MKTLDELAQALQQYRKTKGLGQKDMRLKIGMSQQQYQRAESGNDLRVSTLLRILEGLDLELQLVPRQQAGSSQAISSDSSENYFDSARSNQSAGVSDSPEQKESSWQGFLGDLED